MSTSIGVGLGFEPTTVCAESTALYNTRSLRLGSSQLSLDRVNVAIYAVQVFHSDDD